MCRAIATGRFDGKKVRSTKTPNCSKKRDREQTKTLESTVPIQPLATVDTRSSSAHFLPRKILDAELALPPLKTAILSTVWCWFSGDRKVARDGWRRKHPMDRNALARKSIVGWLASILLLVGLTAAQDAPSGAIDRTQDDSLEQLETLAYRPQELVSGPLRLAGSDTLQQAAVQWIAGFTAIHPEVQAELSSTNSEDGWAKLQKGECDVALMSRPVEAAELERLGKEGKQVVQLTVGIDRLVFIAHPSNPIREIPWNAEEGILGSQSSGGNWGRWLSGQSEWNDLPIALHGTQLGSGTRWHLERLLNGPSAFTGQIQEHASTSEVVEAVAGQEGALGLVSVSHGIGDQVRVVPLAWAIEQKLVDDPIPGSLRTPDCRPLFAVAIVESNDQGLRWPPLHREFVEYLLSYSGQVDMVKDGFLPLTRGEIHAQREMAGLEIQR